jgi:hypothetical protein
VIQNAHNVSTHDSLLEIEAEETANNNSTSFLEGHSFMQPACNVYVQQSPINSYHQRYLRQSFDGRGKPIRLKKVVPVAQSQDSMISSKQYMMNESKQLIEPQSFSYTINSSEQLSPSINKTPRMS